MTMIDITLPDGSVNEYAAGVTCAEVITDALGKKHGCLAAKVDGVECDLSRALMKIVPSRAFGRIPKRGSTSYGTPPPTCSHRP